MGKIRKNVTGGSSDFFRQLLDPEDDNILTLVDEDGSHARFEQIFITSGTTLPGWRELGIKPGWLYVVVHPLDEESCSDNQAFVLRVSRDPDGQDREAYEDNPAIIEKITERYLAALTGASVETAADELSLREIVTDMDNLLPVRLQGQDGNDLFFEQLAVIPGDEISDFESLGIDPDDLYLVLKSLRPIEQAENADGCLIYRLEGDDNLSLEEDVERVQAVYRKYLLMVAQAASE